MPRASNGFTAAFVSADDLQQVLAVRSSPIQVQQFFITFAHRGASPKLSSKSDIITGFRYYTGGGLHNRFDKQGL